MVGRRADRLRRRFGSNFTAADGHSARLALRLTIKPVWDPEMQRRGIAPSDSHITFLGDKGCHAMRRRKRVPKFSLHKASGQTRTIIDGKHIYLGPYGSQESGEAYAVSNTQKRIT
jgi:hypothetical protein